MEDNLFKDILITQNSETFCASKFFYLRLDASSARVSACCKSIPDAFDIMDFLKDPNAALTPPSLIEARQAMLKSERPEACNYCWDPEAQGLLHSRRFEDTVHRFRVESQRPVTHTQTHITELDIGFDNVCNLNCMYCTGANSSRIQEELTRYGTYPHMPYQDNNQVNKLSKAQREAYYDKFYETVVEMTPHAKRLTVSGGEPLLSRRFWDYLKYLNSLPDLKANLAICTNLMVTQPTLARLYDQLSVLEAKGLTLSFSTSCDTYGTDAEYLRNGLCYETLFVNLKTLLTQYPIAPIQINAIVNTLSVREFHRFTKDVIALMHEHANLSLFLTWLHVPAVLSASNLPLKVREQFVHQLEHDFTANGLYDRLRGWDSVRTQLLRTHTREHTLDDILNTLDERDRRMRSNATSLKTWLTSLNY